MEQTMSLHVKRYFIWMITRIYLLAITGCTIFLIVNMWNASAWAADVNINVSSKKQLIDGFGASSAWSGAMNDKIFNGLYTDLGFSILRVRIEDAIGDNWKSGNFSSWSSELSNAKKAKTRGAIVFASPWSPPKSMQESFTHPTDKTNPFRLNYTKYQEYLDYLNAYVKYFKDNGVDLYAISIQNEPDYANDWCWWTPTEMLNFMKNYAGKINTRVIAPESFQFLKNMSDPLLNDPTALDNMDILGFHIYGTPVSNFAYPLFQQKAAPLGKKLWQTEHFIGDNADITISNVLSIAKEIHDCMVTGSFNAYVYWWIPHANGLCTSSGDLYKRAYAIGQYAKFIRPGYNRVDATATPATNVYVSAYTGNNEIVIVVVNTNTGAVNQKFNLQNASVTQFSTWQTTANTNMTAGSTVNVTANSFTYNLPGQSITTFVGANKTVSVDNPKFSNYLKRFKIGPVGKNIIITPVRIVKPYNISVRTIDGSTIVNMNISAGTIAIPMHAKGTYLFEIKSEGYSQLQKVLLF